jgi:hypothetical protein
LASSIIPTSAAYGLESASLGRIVHAPEGRDDVAAQSIVGISEILDQHLLEAGTESRTRLSTASARTANGCPIIYDQTEEALARAIQRQASDPKVAAVLAEALRFYANAWSDASI